MYPVLFKIGGFPVYTLGLFIAAGLLISITVFKNIALRENFDPETINDFLFWTLLAAVIGSRLFFVFTKPLAYLPDPMEILKIWDGGFNFYGGFFSGCITGAVYMKRNQIQIWKMGDSVTIPLAIGLLFGRLGCFFTGCCYGKITDLPWGVRFSHPESLAPPGIPLHPTQIYFALINLFILGVVLIVRKYQSVNGQIFWLFIFIYGSLNSMAELFRADTFEVDFFGFYSLNQLMSLFMAFLAAVVIINHIFRGEEKNNAQDCSQ